MKKVRKVQLILLLVMFAAAMTAAFLSQCNTPILLTVFIVIAIGTLIGTLIYTFIYWRCPRCGRRLSTRDGFWDEYCPRCGEDLYQEEG
jgi:hypothetical protein